MSAPAICIYYLPLAFPCGEGSSCCGPVGQSDEQIQSYVAALRAALGPVEVHTIDVTRPLDLSRDRAALKLLDSFGAMALPIFALDGEVLSMGPPSMSEVIHMLKARLAPQA